MDSLIIEESGLTPDNLPYYIIINESLGTRNGYVGVFKNHPYYKTHYTCGLSDIEDYEQSIEYKISVHGGITYSGFLQTEIIGADNPYYFGFDCGHLGDGKISPDDMDLIIDETKFNDNTKQKLKNSYRATHSLFATYGVMNFNSPNELVRSKEYVREECFKLSSQLIKLEDI